MSKDEELQQAITQTASQLVHDAMAKGLQLGTAESCTAGLVVAAIADIPGASAILKGGIVSYAIAVKQAILGVSKDIFETPELGAVSAECAQQMADGAVKALSCDVAVSVTGIAGPGGAEPGKPVGTVWFGLSSSQMARSLCCHFDGDRMMVRRQAVLQALQLLLEAVHES